MSHFHGSIKGNAGGASRSGTKDSGIDAHVQSNYSRLTVDMRHLGSTAADKRSGDVFTSQNDIAEFTIGPGRSTYGRSRSVRFNPNAVAEALDTGDPRIERIWNKIDKAFRELDEQAPAAIERTAKRKERAQRKAEQERKHRANMQGIAIATMRPEEKARAVKVMPLVELDSNGDFEKDAIEYLTRHDMGNLRKGDDERIYIDARPEGHPGRFTFCLTEGMWIFPFAPDDLHIDESALLGFGVRVDEMSTV